jgi:hypothetical protein
MRFEECCPVNPESPKPSDSPSRRGKYGSIQIAAKAIYSQVWVLAVLKTGLLSSYSIQPRPLRVQVVWAWKILHSCPVHPLQIMRLVLTCITFTSRRTIGSDSLNHACRPAREVLTGGERLALGLGR